MIFQTIVLLASRMQEAMQMDDIATFCQLLVQRTPLVSDCLGRWEGLDITERLALAPLWQATLDEDATTLRLAEDWLHQARAQLIHLRRGAQALRGYQAPYSLEARATRVPLA